jgi:hypothetical protein
MRKMMRVFFFFLEQEKYFAIQTVVSNDGSLEEVHL